MNVPQPQGLYIPATRHNHVIFVSGMTPRNAGVLKHYGPVDPEWVIETYRPAAEIAARNSCLAARNMLNVGEELETALSMTVFVNCGPDFQDHSIIADFASQYLCEREGLQIGSRAAIGASSLPGSAALEIVLIVSVRLPEFS